VLHCSVGFIGGSMICKLEEGISPALSGAFVETDGTIRQFSKPFKNLFTISLPETVGEIANKQCPGLSLLSFA